MKCEENVKGTNYQDNSSCELINTIIPRMASSLKGSASGTVAKVFAWLFGAMIVIMGWYIYRLHKILAKDAAETGSFNLMGGTTA